MTAIMLTARDAHTGVVLDVTTFDARQRDELHGARTAHRHGHEPRCRHCDSPVHLVVNQHHTLFWRHHPGESRRCLSADVTRGESEAHANAKVAIVTSLRRLRGWEVHPEHRFEGHGEIVVADVYAAHNRPREHQASTLWEVQLSPQPHGVFVDRTEQRRRIAGHRTAWVTPHDNALGDQLGIVTDPACAQVVARLWRDLDGTPLPPMSVGGFVNAVAARRARLLWAQSGDDGEWVAYPPDATGGIAVPARRRSSTTTVDLEHHEDATTCRRADELEFMHECINAGSPPSTLFEPPASRPTPLPAYAVTYARPSERPMHCGHSLHSVWPDGIDRCSWCGRHLRP